MYTLSWSNYLLFDALRNNRFSTYADYNSQGAPLSSVF